MDFPLDAPASHPPELIEHRSALEAFAEHVATSPVVAVDIEGNSLYAYREQICIVQVTAGDWSVILDPMALENLGPLREALDRRDVEVLFHGGDFDVALLTRDHDWVFRRVFDTMIAATILARPKLGLADLVREGYGVELDKRFQTVDWARRPLTPEQIDYLHRDTIYLPGLRDALGAELEAADLVEEAEIEFAYLAGRSARPQVFDPDGWRRIKGAGRVDDAGRAILARLHAWREAESERRDRPPFKVLAPRVMLALALEPPREAARPEQLRAVPPRERGRYGAPILRALKEGLADADAGRIPPRDPTPRPDSRERERRRRERKVEEALKVWRRAEATERKVPNLVVFPNRALVWLAREAPRDVDALEDCVDLGPKRIDRYGEALLEVIAKAIAKA